MSWCTRDDGRCPNATDDGDCAECLRLEGIEAAHWKRLYDATPRDVRALDYATGHPERVRLDEEMRDAGRGPPGRRGGTICATSITRKSRAIASGSRCTDGPRTMRKMA